MVSSNSLGTDSSFYALLTPDELCIQLEARQYNRIPVMNYSQKQVKSVHIWNFSSNIPFVTAKLLL